MPDAGPPVPDDAEPEGVSDPGSERVADPRSERVADPRSERIADSDPERSLAPLMGATYVAAGVAHFLVPRRFATAIPPAFPRPVGLVFLSGAAEILLGVGVAVRRTRRASAWGIVALLVAVFPANVHLARSDALTDLVPERLVGPARLAAWVRLPFQAVLIGWALRYADGANAGDEGGD